MTMRVDNAAAVGVAARLLREARENVSSALLAVGVATCATAARAAVSSSSLPATTVLPYGVWLGALAAAIVAGFCTMWAAVWVAGDAPRRRAAGQVILCAAFVPLVVTVALSCDDHTLAVSIFNAML